MWASLIRVGKLLDLNISQDRFEVLLATKVNLKGKSSTFRMPGVVVESVLTFKDVQNSSFGFLGEIGSGKITIKPDVNAILASWPVGLKAPSRRDLAECAVTLVPTQR